MFDFQASLIFPTHAVPPAGSLPPGAERLSLETGDGNRLEGIHIPAEGHSAEKVLILGFGGNAWNGQDVAEYLHELFPHAAVIAFHYRGYAPSTGSPSAEVLIADGPLIYDLAVEYLKPARTVAVGFSIGTGIAAELAARRRLDGLILVTPFDSLKAVAQGHYPWLPVGVFFREEMNPVESLRGLDTPVALIAGGRDTLIPTRRTEALRRKVPNLVFDRTIVGAGHNDIYERPEFRQAMREASVALKG